MKKIICFLLLIAACTTNAQTKKYVITGDDTYGNIAVSIFRENGTPISIGTLTKGQTLTYTLNDVSNDDFVYIKAESTTGYVFINDNDEYYDLYLNYLNDTGNYFDEPEEICIREAYGIYTVEQGVETISCFVGTLPKI